jgi:hypothetical protein
VGQTLIEYGADVNFANAVGNTILDAALRHPDFVTLLLEQPQLSVESKSQALHFLLSRVNLNFNLIRLLLESGAREPYLESYYSLELMNLLLEYGSDINAADEYGETALADLFDQFYDINERSQHNNNRDKIVRIITDPKFNPDIILTKEADDDTEHNETYLMHVALKDPNDDEGFIQLLLDAGADPSIKVDGRNAYEYARDSEDKGCRLVEGYCGEKLQRAAEVWPRKLNNAITDLDKKFLIGERLKNTQALPQRQPREYIIRKAEYDNLCQGLNKKLDKPGLIALARSLRIPTFNQSKFQLCHAIAERLTLTPK